MKKLILIVLTFSMFYLTGCLEINRTTFNRGIKVFQNNHINAESTSNVLPNYELSPNVERMCISGLKVYFILFLFPFFIFIFVGDLIIYHRKSNLKEDDK